MNPSSSRRFRLRLVLATLPAVAVFVSAFTHASAQQQSQPGSYQQAANLTGKGGFIDSPELKASRLRMEAGARTHWHIHPAGQVIVAEEGEGLYQEQGGAVKRFGPGQAVYLKANVLHWHGAAPNSGVTQATMYEGAPKWGDPVTDEEYAGKKKR
jgi:quercetin dioxygenase-like cupin family protein